MCVDEGEVNSLPHWFRMVKESEAAEIEVELGLLRGSSDLRGRIVPQSNLLSTLTMVFPESPDDSPPFPLSSSASFSLSTSASLQTHLSSFNSEQRLHSSPLSLGTSKNRLIPILMTLTTKRMVAITLARVRSNNDSSGS